MTVNITLNEISVNNAMRILRLFDHDPALEVFTKGAEVAYKDLNVSRISTRADVAASAPTDQSLSADKSADAPDVSEPKTEKTQTQYTIEDLRAAFSSYAKKHGKDKAKEILARFNASKVTEIKESDYNAVVQDIKQ